MHLGIFCHSTLQILLNLSSCKQALLSLRVVRFGSSEDSAWVTQGHSELSLCHLGRVLTLIVLREREASSQTEVLECSGSGHHQAPLLGIVVAGCLVSSKYSI